MARLRKMGRLVARDQFEYLLQRRATSNEQRGERGSDMPTYVFKCTACKKRFEVDMSIADREKGKKVTCPKCKGKKIERVFTSFFAKTSKKS